MSKAMKIAIVDDEKDMRQSISQWLALSGFDTETFASAEDALKGLSTDYPGIVVSDIKMPGMDGMQFLRKLKGVDSSLPVIMITGHGDVPMAVEAMRLGAFDFLEKPFNPDRMTELAKKATQARRLTLDNRVLRRELSDGSALIKKLIGSSAPMERLKEDILDLGQADGHVLIEGETGTGKTLVAHALHAVGARATKKFVLVSCSAFDEEALSRRVFGPAQDDEPIPAIEEARGGTLVLEDIEALSQSLQARLLMSINEQGAPAETRIVAICNLQEQDKTCESVLRPDLFYRLAVIHIELPPLRERGDDVLLLAESFLKNLRPSDSSVSGFSEETMACFQQYHWPGNIRELRNVIERSVTLARGEQIEPSDLPPQLRNNESSEPHGVSDLAEVSRDEALDSADRAYLTQLLKKHDGVIASAARQAGLSRQGMSKLLKRHGIEADNFRN